MDDDPDVDLTSTDLTSHHIEGIAVMGNVPFSVPLISDYGTLAEGHLWQGGCIDGLTLVGRFDFIMSMYPHEKYKIDVRTDRMEVRMHDNDGEIDRDLVFELAAHVWFRLERGNKVLVHCQAGLNRSSLIVATVLVRHAGLSPAEAIETIRAQRCDACLCNASFEEFVHSLARPPLRAA